ncbi:aminoglycoside phosphotransferase family protein [Streptomyces sp. ID05-04B]|uniref:phosphotransferase family protein n=1 Tax=Streptomyces sp. ID05-04B TaxID=3028661 RepID=UPI0029C4D17F|nr:aminoglycoside phosphotransferase family protein [Streptomyces sp. ID05-04B]MDX5563184.1 aminoglycoside phosphotransferase family protein [Streptomyces sp. ID05-04B]
MKLRLIPRPPTAFQQSVTADAIETICQRAFGTHTEVLSAVELGTGLYNTTLKVTVAERERPAILRIAPEPDRQFVSERELMRTEYASLPYLASLAPLMPQVIAVDFTHEVLGRDYMVQTLLDGTPAPQHLRTYPPSMWSAYYRQLGEITRSVHTVRGRNFGPVAGPTYRTWSEAITASLDTIAVDLEAAGLGADDVRTVAAAAARHHTVLDEINEPRLLAGDLWLPNTLLRNDAREPTITGVHDLDRTWWGDPASDWTIRMIKAKPDQRQAFWETYGRPDQSDAAIWRSTIYEARHLGSVRLERHRLGNRDGVQNTYASMAALSAIVA